MANQQRIHKSLAGQEDILYGEGEVSQERSGGTYPISKVRSIYPVNSLAELEALDSDKFPKAALYEDDGITYYVYNTDTSQYEVTASSSGSYVGELPPAIIPRQGDRWTRCTDMKGFIWYVDVDGGQWVEDNPSYNDGTISDVSIPYIFDTAADYQASTTFFPVGKTVHLNDRDADFKIIAGTSTADGFGVIANNNTDQSTEYDIKQGDINSRAFGVMPSASIDNTQPLQDYLDYSGVNKIIVGGVYKLSSELLIPETVTSINMDVSTEIIQTVKRPIFFKRGSVFVSESFGSISNIDKGDTFINIPSSDYQVGDYIYFRCNNLTPNVTAGSRISVIRKVYTKSGSSYRFDKPFFRPMTSSITARKLNLTEKISIKGGTLKHESPVDNKESLIQFYCCFAPDLENVTIKDNGGPAVLLQNTVGGSFVNCHISDLLNDEQTDSQGVTSLYRGYGVCASGATRDFTMLSGSVGRVRHAFTTITLNPNSVWDPIPASEKGTVELRGEPEGIYVGPVYCYECTEAALDTHEQGYDITFTPNVTSSFKGFQIRATDVFIDGGVIHGSRRYGLILNGPAANSVSDVSLSPVINGLYINTVGQDGLNLGTESIGFYSTTDSSVTEASGLIVSGCKDAAVRIKSSSSGVGDIIRMRSSIIDGKDMDSIGVDLQASGSLIQTTTVKNCDTGIQSVAGETNDISLVTFSNNTTDEVVN